MNKALIDISVADWDGIMAVNARGNFLHSREAVRVMLERGSGAIVDLVSIVLAQPLTKCSFGSGFFAPRMLTLPMLIRYVCSALSATDGGALLAVRNQSTSKLLIVEWRRETGSNRRHRPFQGLLAMVLNRLNQWICLMQLGLALRRFRRV